MGANQLVLDIYNVNDAETKSAVEKYLLQAREYIITEYIPEEASTTASYSDMPRSYTGITTNQTFRLAAINVDEPMRRKKHIERANKAISRLSKRQQQLINIRYMEDNELFDYEIAMELGFSESTYRRAKSVAILRLASILGLIVFHE